MARKTRKLKSRRAYKTKSMRKYLRRSRRRGGMPVDEEEYSEFAGGARDNDPSCTTPGQPNNRNNLPYYPYIARGSLNSGFQYGDILMQKGGLIGNNDPQVGAGKYKRTKSLKKYRKAKRGGTCGGQSRESWFRGAYPVLMT